MEFNDIPDLVTLRIVFLLFGFICANNYRNGKEIFRLSRELFTLKGKVEEKESQASREAEASEAKQDK